MSATAEAEVAGAPPLTVPLAALALASASSTFYTTGPNRPGFIQFNVQLDRLHGGSSDAQFSDGVHTYSYNVLGFGSTASLFCGPESCGWTAILPFDLGVHLTRARLHPILNSPRRMCTEEGLMETWIPC